MCLLGRVVAVDIDGIVQILRALAAHPDSAAATCNNRLAKIVIKVLFWVSVAGIEFTNAGVIHRGNPVLNPVQNKV